MVKKLALGCGGILVLLIIIGIVSQAGKAPSSDRATGSSASAGAAKVNHLDASADGYELKVNDVNRNVPVTNEFLTPEAGSHFVRVMVTFINHSGDPQRPDFFCCKLQDSTGLTHDTTFSGTGCDAWQGVEMGKGSSFGPRPLCFQAAGDPNAPLTLIWTPAFGHDAVNIALQ